MAAGPDIPATRVFGQGVDFGRTAQDYRTFRAGFPPAFFEAMAARGWLVPGAVALDLGTGTGTVARGLALAGLSVTGIDPAAAMLAEAEALDREEGVQVRYRTGKAEILSEGDGSVDLVTAGQCWHWFDRPAAARECARVLRPGGRVVIAHFDWLPLEGNVVAETEAQILRYNPAWTMGGGTGLYPAWLADLSNAGFGGLETFSFDLPVPYTHEGWRGRIRASAGVRASLDRAAVARFDAELAERLARDFSADPLEVPHRVWVVSGRAGKA